MDGPMATMYAMPVLGDRTRWFAVVSDIPGGVTDPEVEAKVRDLLADLTDVDADSFDLNLAYCRRRDPAKPATYIGRITGTYTRRMSVTTVEIQSEVRDRLAQIAAKDYPGVTLSEVLARLLAEHEDARTRRDIVAGYARLQADPDAWADYMNELSEWDSVTSDGAHRE
jgi:hypothetical protein